MYELQRISLMNWNLIELEDLEISGATALIGAVGVGKSTLLDAIQTVLSGNQKSKLKLNRAAGVQASKRTVLEYCLGHTEETLATGLTRSHCDSIIVLTFHDEQLKHSVSIGLVLYAEEGAIREETRHRFVAPGVDFSFRAFGEHTPEGEPCVSSWEALLKRVRDASGEGYMQTTHARAEHFIDTYLKTMRTGAASPNATQFLKRFRNAIAFEEIANPTEFVRDFVLDEDPIDTELLRSNLETWDEIARKIELNEKKLSGARAERARFARLAVHRFDQISNEFQIVWHGRRAALIDADGIRRNLRSLGEQISRNEEKAGRLRTRIDNERAEKERKKDKEREAGLTDARALAVTRIEAETEKRSNEIHTLRQGLDNLGKIASTRDLRHYLPAYVEDAQLAAEEIREYARRLNPNDPVPDEDVLQDMLRRVIDGKSARDALAANYQRELEELAGMRKEASDLDRLVRNRHEKAPVLDAHVTRFMERLLTEGISASSLPELVEIAEGKEEWVRAAEAALGPFREAIFVAPKDLPDAHRSLRGARQGGKQDLWRVRLINTARIAEGRNVKPAKDGAVVSILETDNELVRQFLDSQFGYVVMVETEEELRSHSSAIMKDGAQSQGLSLRVHEQRDPVLGQAAQAALRANLQYKLSHLRQNIEAKDRLVKRLGHGVNIFEMVSSIDMASFAGWLEALRESYRRIEELRAERDRQVTPEIRALLDEIAEHDRRIETFEVDLEEITSKLLKHLEREKIKAEYRLDELEQEISAHGDEIDRIARKDLGEPYTTYRKALSNFEHEARGRSISVLHHALERASDLDADGHRAKIKELQRQLLKLEGETNSIISYTRRIPTFLKEYEEDITVAERSPAEILTWLVALIFKLEDDVLRRYRERVQDIRKQTREEVREMLVVRLSDKFKRAKEELRNLNKRLKKHRFEGLTYLFTWSIDPEMQGLYEMTQRVTRNPERAQALLSGGGEPLLDEAVVRIREIFAGGLDANKWEDYRQYFTFELRMTLDEVGDDQIEAQDTGVLRNVTFTGDLTSRVGKGSGGQKQTPYYVAIAASMAAACYPGVRHDSGRGMGLVCFDEAFSKLDITNTQNLLRFFRDLGLQVIVAAPEEKRTSFMEIMDTVVNISKVPGETDLYFRTIAVGERAKEALKEANPERKGIEGFRSELEAAAKVAE